MDERQNPHESLVFSRYETKDFAALSVAERYQLLVAGIVPRPIAFITTIDDAGVVNLAPFSFFNGISSDPPCLVVSFARKRDGSKKDSLRNIEANGEFVVNSSQASFAERLNATSAELPYGESELLKEGFTPLASRWVRPPRVDECWIQFECRLKQTVEIGPGGAGSATLVIGEILGMHVSPHAMTDGKIDYAKLAPIARLGGTQYLRGGDVFSLSRPR